MHFLINILKNRITGKVSLDQISNILYALDFLSNIRGKKRKMKFFNWRGGRKRGLSYTLKTK